MQLPRGYWHKVWSAHRQGLGLVIGCRDKATGFVKVWVTSASAGEAKRCGQGTGLASGHWRSLAPEIFAACRDLEAARRDAGAAQATAAAAATELTDFRTAADERQRRFHMLNAGFKKKEEGLREELAAARDAAAAAQDAAESATARLASAEEVQPLHDPRSALDCSRYSKSQGSKARIRCRYQSRAGFALAWPCLRCNRKLRPAHSRTVCIWSLSRASPGNQCQLKSRPCQPC